MRDRMDPIDIVLWWALVETALYPNLRTAVGALPRQNRCHGGRTSPRISLAGPRHSDPGS